MKKQNYPVIGIRLIIGLRRRGICESLEGTIMLSLKR